MITPVAVVGTVVALVAATSIPAVAAKAPSPPPSAVGARHRAAGQGAGGGGLDRPDPGHRPQRIRQRDYDVEPFNGGILGCGVTDGAEYQEKGVDAPMAVQCRGAPPRPQWPALWKADIAKDHPNVVMILAGRWEVSNRTYDGHWTNIENPTYAAYVQAPAPVRGAAWPAPVGPHVVLMTAPCYDSGEQPDGQPWPEDSPDPPGHLQRHRPPGGRHDTGHVAPQLQRHGLSRRSLRGVHGRPAGAPRRRHPLHLHRRQCLRAPGSGRSS